MDVPINEQLTFQICDRAGQWCDKSLTSEPLIGEKPGCSLWHQDCNSEAGSPLRAIKRCYPSVGIAFENEELMSCAMFC
ncbi:hypothetical protein CEE69_18465 [Rhodopirellula bahusiensis]|uniref:Uncharacterized protein n=1 Tax=Rhodopirellula bahusiensis TaxID=2014065 RepID=A0A2G1W4Y5_9BACT|nr:hypothetical protein CEE69_18465 [Rhodopirellula bahusiensis]